MNAYPRLRAAGLLVLPLVYAIAAGKLLRDQGPYWGGYLNDPSYTYLLNSLAVASGRVPYHIDHPGTPVQIFGAIVLRALHPTLGERELVATVFAQAEHYAQVISVALIACAVVATAAVGGWIFIRTQRLAPALIAQVGPLLLPSMFPGYSGIRPEPLLLVWTQIWIGTWILWAEGRLDLGKPRTIIGLAFIGGVGVATKYTFAPLLLIALWLLPTLRARIIFSLATGLVFLIAIAPALPHARRMASWIFRLTTRGGIYGSGPASVGPSEGWWAAWTQTLRTSPSFLWAFVVTLVLTVWWWRSPRATDAVVREYRLLIAVMITWFAATIMIAKQAHGSGRYLLCAEACAPVVLYAAHQRLARAAPARAARSASVLGLAAMAALYASSLSTQLAWARDRRQAAVDTQAWIVGHLTGARVIPAFGASSLVGAFGQNGFPEWAPIANRLFADPVWCSIWHKAFYRTLDTEHPVPKPSGVFYLHAAVFNGGVVEQALRELGWTMEPVWETAYEAVYRITPRADLAK